MAAFAVGELFSSFEGFKKKLEIYSKQTYTHFYIKDSRKLTPCESINPSLVYRNIHYSCIYGGQKARFRGTGARTVSSIRYGCPASLYLRLTKNKKFLEVRSFLDEHNHILSPELYHSAIQDKKLPEDLKAKIEDLLLLGADKSRLCDYIRFKTRKILGKKNLFNLYEQASRQNRAIPRDRAIKLIQEVYQVDERGANAILVSLLRTQSIKRRSITTANLVKYPDSTIVKEENVEEVMERVEISDNDDTEERIVILEDGQEFQLIKTDSDQQYEEYLSEAGDEEFDTQQQYQQSEETIVEEHEEDATKQQTREFILSEGFPRKRKAPNVLSKVGQLQIQGRVKIPKTVPLTTRKIFRNDVMPKSMSIISADDTGKLANEMEILNRAKRNKIVKEINKLEMERTKYILEIELMKEQKKLVSSKLAASELVKQNQELLNEKLKLEVAKLKEELGKN